MATKNGHGGARPGSGRKTKAEILGLHELLTDAVPPAKQKEICRKLAQDALSPTPAVRHPARVLLLSYLYGKPTERHELTGADGSDIKQIIEVIFTKADGTE